MVPTGQSLRSNRDLSAGTGRKMSKPLAVVVALLVVLPPMTAAARAPEPGASQAVDLEPRASDEWWRLGSPEHQLQLVLSLDAERPASTSPAYLSVGLLYLRAIAGSASFVGSGIGYYRSLSSRSGSTIVGGGPAELLLTPRLFTVPIALRLAFGPRLYAAFEPALVVGWVTAAVAQTSGALVDTSSKPGLGFQLGVGFETQFTDRLGLSVRAGYRAVRPTLTCNRQARDGQPLAVQTESVNVDLTGPFLTGGLVFQL